MNNEIIAAIATGFNNSGIGIVRISGSGSFSLIKKIFKKKDGSSFEDIDSHRVYYGFIMDGEDVLDEVLVVPMKSPHSFTTEDTVEIDCHGGNLVLRRILELVLRCGARIAEPGEFTKRAFLNGRLDLSEAEAVIDVINSKNDLFLKNSLRQLKGDLYKDISNIRQELLYEIARIESALDDPEHYDLTGYSSELKEKLLNVIERIRGFIKGYENGRIIKEGIKTVILGKPNVGKSSFLNMLSGYEKSIVTDIPGTTRDVIEESVILDGLNLILYDTAGIRESDDKVEQIGVKKAMESAGNSDLLILMIDSSDDLTSEDIDLFGFIKDKNAIVLYNKSDLNSVIHPDDLKKYTDKDIVKISVKDKTGISELSGLINDMFIKGSLSYNDEVMITNERHKKLLDDSLNSLSNVMVSIDSGLPEDFYSIDLKDAYDSLGMIIGENTGDDIIDMIFSEFCLGK
ncbi:MAG: tRNA uridine-5-carboxymethylaminomethyl(34) synthesis GTPase MnmE [Lachnospiraceae bacterium]|nr:tRNA uridine-5-carboxymethylaminomethyl(34) synthesis GTPase MnmE [Lachnospiraceae bacterium]